MRARSYNKVISIRDVEFIELTGFANVLIVHVSTSGLDLLARSSHSETQSLS
jgi:hypothetical protein